MKTKRFCRTIRDDIMDAISVFTSLFVILYVSLFVMMLLYTAFNTSYGFDQWIYINWGEALIPIMILSAIGTMLFVFTSTVTRLFIRHNQNKLMKLYASIYVSNFSLMTQKEKKEDHARKSMIILATLFNAAIPYIYIICSFVTIMKDDRMDPVWIQYCVVTIVIMLIVAFIRYRQVPRNLRQIARLLLSSVVFVTRSNWNPLAGIPMNCLCCGQLIDRRAQKCQFCGAYQGYVKFPKNFMIQEK